MPSTVLTNPNLFSTSREPSTRSLLVKDYTPSPPKPEPNSPKASSAGVPWNRHNPVSSGESLGMGTSMAAPNSKDPKEFCRYCKQYGHVISECPKLIAQGRRAGASHPVFHARVASPVLSENPTWGKPDVGPNDL